MVTTAMGSPVVTEALTDAPDLVAGRTGERAPVGFQLLRPAGAGCPDAHTPVRSAPVELVGTEDRRPRVVRDRGASRARSASVRSQSGWTAPHIVGQRIPARRISAAPSPERGTSVDRVATNRPQRGSPAQCPQAPSSTRCRGPGPREDRAMRAVLGAVLLVLAQLLLPGVA